MNYIHAPICKLQAPAFRPMADLTTNISIADRIKRTPACGAIYARTHTVGTRKPAPVTKVLSLIKE